MHTNLSRRAFACGTSLAAIAAPFPTLAEVNASPDHELLVLGSQLERLLADRHNVEDMHWEAINQLDDAIMAIAPKTMQGLAVQARVTSWRCLEVWYEDHAQIRPFLETVYAFLGVRSLYSECEA